MTKKGNLLFVYCIINMEQYKKLYPKMLFSVCLYEPRWQRSRLLETPRGRGRKWPTAKQWTSVLRERPFQCRRGQADVEVNIF